jgi:hypothetical protein
MANLKISQLPEYTGSTLGSWLIANNSGESETFKIQREDFLNGYAPSSDVSALSSSIAATDLGQNNRLTTIEGRYATTGSNTFVGTETISGSVIIQGSGNTALNVNGGNSLFSGSIIINGSSASGQKYLFFNNASGSAGATLSYNPSVSPSGSLGITSGFGGQINIGGTVGTNTIAGDTKITGSAHNITGSLGIRGNVQMTGSLTQTGSLVVSSSVGGIYNQLFSAHGNYIKGNLGSNYIDSDSGSNYIFGSRIQLNGPGNTTGAVVQVQGNLSITGSFGVSGSITQTGSVQGNVNALSISSNTASLNLNDGNFFTLQLVSGSATHLNPSNIKPGQTVSVFVNTTGSATMTFPSSIKQISGSAYVPTTSTGLDVLTLISKDSSNLYLVNAKNFI